MADKPKPPPPSPVQIPMSKRDADIGDLWNWIVRKVRRG